MPKLSRLIPALFIQTITLQTNAFILNDESLNQAESCCSHLKPDKVKDLSGPEMKGHLEGKVLRQETSNFLKSFSSPKQIKTSDYLKSFLITRHPELSLGEMNPVKEKALISSERLNLAHDMLCRLIERTKDQTSSEVESALQRHLDYLEQKSMEFKEALKELDEHLLQERIAPFLAIEKAYLNGRLKGEIVKGNLYNFEAKQLRSQELDLAKSYSIRGLINLRQERYKL